jgi:hypothetical protein
MNEQRLQGRNFAAQEPGSCLAKPQATATHYFLMDLDTARFRPGNPAGLPVTGPFSPMRQRFAQGSGAR